MTVTMTKINVTYMPFIDDNSHTRSSSLAGHADEEVTAEVCGEDGRTDLG